MSRYVAFLRGVNLGSRRRVKGEDLRLCFEGLGFEDVATFRTSGNVIFASPQREHSFPPLRRRRSRFRSACA